MPSDPLGHSSYVCAAHHGPTGGSSERGRPIGLPFENKTLERTQPVPFRLTQDMDAEEHQL